MSTYRAPAIIAVLCGGAILWGVASMRQRRQQFLYADLGDANVSHAGHASSRQIRTPLVVPRTPPCVNISTSSCREMPPADAHMGWGSVRLCDVPWGLGTLQGRWYWWLPSFVKALPTSPGRPFVLDVGGNVGFFTIAIAAAGVRVASFEPLPRNLEYLEMNVCANAASGLVTIVPTALGAVTVPEGIVMKIPPRSDSASVAGPKASTGADGKPLSGEVVPLVSLDDWIESTTEGEWDAADLVWLKMDVQGYESLVLEGAKRIVSRATHPLFRITAEENDWMWKEMKGGSSPSALLESWGFVSASMTSEGDTIWVNPKTFRGGNLSHFPQSVPSPKRPAAWWDAGGTLLPALADVH